MNLGCDLTVGCVPVQGAAWTPASLGPAVLSFDYDPARGVTLATGISQLLDSSGNGNTLTQGTAGLQPAFNASDANFNSRPSVAPDGVNDVMTAVDSVSLSPTASMSLFFVVRNIGVNRVIMARGVYTVSSSWTVQTSLGDATSLLILLAASAGDLYGAYAQTPTASLPTGSHVVELHYDGSLSGAARLEVRIDGTVSAWTPVASFVPPASLVDSSGVLYNDAWDIGRYANGTWARKIGTRRVLSASERSTMRVYLGKQYGITVVP